MRAQVVIPKYVHEQINVLFSFWGTKAIGYVNLAFPIDEDTLHDRQ